MLIHWSKITPRFVTDPLGVIEDVPICNAGVFRDLTQCGDAKYKIFLEDFESSIATAWGYSPKYNQANCV